MPGAQVFQSRVTSAAASGILDGISNVAAAYSLRQLRTAYAGSAVRVRRSSDSTEQDIGFDGSGEFDSSAFSAFVGGGTGYVKKWYDQSGNGRDATQTTAGNQPTIALNVVNGKATIRWSTDFLDLASPVALSSFAFLIAWQSAADSSLVGSLSNYQFRVNRAGQRKMSMYLGVSEVVSSTLATSTANWFIAGYHYNGTTGQLRENGVSVASSTLGSTSPNFGRIGMTIGTSLPFVGDAAELIFISTSIPTTDHNTIGADMATRYGLSWTTVT